MIKEERFGRESVYEEITGGSDFELGTAEVNSRAYCSWFGFRWRPTEESSTFGGERNRVQLAKVLRSGANVLLLDEPTNDLDVDTINPSRKRY